MFERFKLQNNADVFLVPLKDSQSTTILVMLPVGSRYETAKLSGVSHYIEHLMFKGTKKRPNTLILTREIDRLGADYNAFTSKEYTGYYIKADKNHTEITLDILSDMLFNSKFDAKEMEREKTVIVEELRMYRDNPLMHIDMIFEELMYEGCPLGWDEGGTDKTVLGFKRNEVLAFRDKYYQPGNMTIAIAGNIDKNIKKILEKYFGRVKSSLRSDHAAEMKYEPARFGTVERNKRLRIDNKKTDQAQLAIGFPAFDYNDANQPPMVVLNTVLGGSMSSRLFIKIRERLGLAYMVRSGAVSFRDTGYFQVRAGLDAKNINKVLAIVKDEANKIIEKGVTPRELADAKTHMRGGLALSLEDSSVQASWYVKEALFRNKIKTPEQRLAEIDVVSNNDIKQTAKKIFDFNQTRVAVIGEIDAAEIKFS
ncbi:MAG: insulinase family protein [Candidatus Magasanikbacteria bacterium]|nr:insulinase family protein [Candidatus Magasanikbacteria bacterium]